MKPNNVKGYLQITLQKQGKKEYKKVHRLVAEAFIENTYNKREVNHIDGNKSNNNATNLEWVTSSENQIHAYKMGLQKLHSRKGKENTLSKKVVQKNINGKIIKIWDYMHDIERETGIKHQSVSACCKGIQKHTHNYKFEYYREMGV